MKEKIEPHMHLIENAKAAMKAVDVLPIEVPIRGGTDGSRLSYMGLPCPNICTGGHNFHGKFEYITVQSMEKTVEILLEIVKRYAK
jgi:tripeptide aminopeptidase